MKTRIRLLAIAVLCITLALTFTACAARDTERIVGRWRMIAYTADDGTAAAIENELDMVFYTTGVGEAQIDGETLYMFDYTLKRGHLFRQISYSATNVVQANESYEFSEDGLTLTVYSPADGATIVLTKIEDQVLNRIEIEQ